MSGVSFARTDSSMVLKGPVSPPDGEMTPKTAATKRRWKLSVPEAKTEPHANIRKEPILMTRLVPIAFAFHVNKYERTESPIIVSDMKSPILDSSMSNDFKYSVST